MEVGPLPVKNQACSFVVFMVCLRTSLSFHSRLCPFLQKMDMATDTHTVLLPLVLHMELPLKSLWKLQLEQNLVARAVTRFCSTEQMYGLQQIPGPIKMLVLNFKILKWFETWTF